MELCNVGLKKISPERQKVIDERENLRNEAAKTYGKYMINMTNLCFDKCINTDSIHFSKKEDTCINSCFLKFKEINNYALHKFYDINKEVNYNISENYITNINDLN